MSDRDPDADRAEFHRWLADALADRIGVPLRATEEAVNDLAADWSVEIQHRRSITDPHDRFVIHTPWIKSGSPELYEED